MKKLLLLLFIVNILFANLPTQLTGYALNGDKGATTGYNISTSAEEYNRQLHEKEIKWIKKHSLEFAKKLYGKNPTKNQIQIATKLLYTSAMYYNNKSSKLWIDANQKEVGYPYSKQDIKEAFSFLQENSKDKTFIDVYKNNFQQQNYFTSTSEQYNTSSYTPDTTIGLKDESYLFIPTSPMLKTTSKASTIVTKESIIQADKLYLQAGIKADNILRTKIVPNMKDGYYKTNRFIRTKAIPTIKDGYYNTANKFLANPTKYTQGGIDFIESYLPGVPTVSIPGYLGGTAGAIYGWEQLYQDLKQLENK